MQYDQVILGSRWRDDREDLQGSTQQISPGRLGPRLAESRLFLDRSGEHGTRVVGIEGGERRLYLHLSWEVMALLAPLRPVQV